LVAIANNAQVVGCSDAEQREAMTAHSKDWKALYDLFRRLSHCDDGAMAENFSDNVVRLLAKEWSHFGELEAFVSSNRRFRRFVLNHVDSTTDPNDLRMIARNSRSQCPATAKQLCEALGSRAKSALKEQAEFSH
jgi:hypothetical protein